MILYTHIDASYLSVSEVKSRTGAFYFICPQLQDGNKTPIVLTDTNGPLYVELYIMGSIMALAMEAKLGALFTNRKKSNTNPNPMN